VEEREREKGKEPGGDEDGAAGGERKRRAPGRRNRGEGGIEFLQGLMRKFRKL
jgi:hypothetical protein